jgi:mono/diheme cytochrome c family protein
MPQFTLKSRKALLAVLPIFALLMVGASLVLRPKDSELIHFKISRIWNRLRSASGLAQIWNDSQEPFLRRIGWSEPHCQNALKQLGLAIVNTDTDMEILDMDWDWDGPIFMEPGTDQESLRPGLVAGYRVKATEISRLEPTVALSIGADEAPHPRLQGNAGTMLWQGYVNILRPGTYRFSAMLRGKLLLEVGDKKAIVGDVQGRQASVIQGQDIHLTAGFHSLTARFTRYPGPARLELLWQAPHFRSEPVPYDHLWHMSEQESAKLARDQLIERGRFFAEEHNCIRCHRPDDKDRLTTGLATRQGPDLSDIGQRAFPGWLYAWLAAPQKIHSGAVMPQLFADDEQGRVECYAVARYLASLGGPLQPNPKLPGSSNAVASRKRGELLFAGIGCLACHSGANALRNLGSKTTPDRLAAYLMNPLAIDPSGRMPDMRLNREEARDLARFLCQAVDRDIPQDLPDAPSKAQREAAFRRVESRLPELVEFQQLSAEGQVLDLGKRLVIDRGCNNCHTIAPGGAAFASMLADASFSDITQPGKLDQGCLSDMRRKQSRSPRFAFSDQDRQALRLFLREGAKGAGSPAPAHAARVALERFNCLACHARDGAGGLIAALTDQLRRVEKAENSEALTPPPLTGVAHKLRTSWMKQVLTQGARARPWMSLRMPQFGEANVGWLPEALAALEGTDPDSRIHKETITAEKVLAGKQLVGKGGFGCTSCHDIAGIPNTGTRGPDLASMDQRVRHDWYRSWLEQAQRMQPGTRMPTIFAEGKSLLPQILGGNADAQAEAIWAYLSLGKTLPLPEGLEPPPGLVLSVKDRPILLRTFMPDASPRAMAIGFPGRISVAFDLTTCRLAYAWSGAFLDASPVWDGRGGNPARLLGPRFWTSPAGCAWAMHTSQEPPDFAAQARDPGYGGALPEGQVYNGPHHLQFDDYSLDELGRPTLHYRLENGGDDRLAIAEQVEPLRSPLASGLARRFVITRPAQTTAWFFAAQSRQNPRILDRHNMPLAVDWKAGQIEFETAGRLLLLPQDGDRLAILDLAAAPGDVSWHLRHVDGQWQALLRIPASAEKARAIVDLKMWILPRDEPALLQDLLRKMARGMKR